MDDKEMHSEIWTDVDAAFELGLESWSAHAVPKTVRPKRIFYAWHEDWEKISIKKNDVVHEAKLLAKCEGLHWLDSVKCCQDVGRGNCPNEAERSIN